MAGAAPRLDELRAEIDGLDERIQELLERRTELAERVSALKREAGELTLFMRPGREAAVVRRVLARHRGPFPKAALFRIWREIISGTLTLEGPLSLALEAGPAGCSELARLTSDHFGSSAPLGRCENAHAVIEALDGGTANVGIVAFPRPGERDPWWARLAKRSPAPIEVVALLPFLERTQAPRRRALVLARTAFDESGDDLTVAALEVGEALAPEAVGDALAAAGFSAEVVADDGARRTLALLQGFVAPEDARFGALRAGAVVQRLSLLGGFARPIAEG
ncbi:MAG TPA: chorismate mutase [Alphaproteobacteria bacterium]|nr:chorismate mutase [Alphaproteobacteria bacterium]